ncbi:hypothetical protein GJAV_G00231880 [Gymnothorax javanicus]|nr:hypothetical protein GJAV_G00231880 [Gymnothorax javanicus]
MPTRCSSSPFPDPYRCKLRAVTSFVEHGKKSAWATWIVLSELTDALVSLARAPTSILETSFHAGQI